MQHPTDLPECADQRMRVYSQKTYKTWLAVISILRLERECRFCLFYFPNFRYLVIGKSDASSLAKLTQTKLSLAAMFVITKFSFIALFITSVSVFADTLVVGFDVL
jgi:hypothetical protein